MVFGDQLWLKAALPVFGNLNGHYTRLPFEHLLIFAIASFVIGVDDRCVLVMVSGHNGI